MKLLVLPQLRQTYNYDCGSKATESVLVYYGLDVRGDEIIKLESTTKSGTRIKNIKEVICRYGLKVKSGKMSIQDLKKYIDKKVPVMIALQAWTNKKNIDWKKNWSDGHYAVVVGYTKDKIIFEDPAAFNYTYLTYSELADRWHDIDTSGKKYFNFGMAIFGKKPKFKKRKLIHMD
ncbi:MAG TPA: cysteine peptidase family C39 domain-containing protein [bacterium]|nr:cysteine peptidase family C39 domain-containing protein [bacterium]HPT29831.1 cysteine peptidase family C39 domain-containing protein [bacterium]